VAVFDPQDNDVQCQQPCCNISGICRVMLDGSVGDAVDRLAAVARLQNSTVRGGRSRAAALAAAGQTQRAALKELPDFWSFQTCAEFGGYMTCDIGSRCFFSQGLLTLPMLMSFCHDSFNISTDAVASNVAATNLRYGGAAPAVTCAVFANGEIDPFSPMGVIESSLDRDLYAFSVPGRPFEPSTSSHSAPTHRTAVVELSVQVRATTPGRIPRRPVTRAA
jgi:thymus-specific serine protease